MKQGLRKNSKINIHNKKKRNILKEKEQRE